MLPALAILAVPACSGSAAPSTHAPTVATRPISRSPGLCCTGLTRVSGVVQIVGGPAFAGTQPRLQPHQPFQILHDGTVVRRIRSDGAGRFTTRLLPGIYTMSPFFITPRLLRVGTTAVSVRLTVNAM